MSEKKTVVVTGGSGFIGSRLCSHLEMIGACVRPILRRDTDKSLRAALCGVDAVAHCAGVTRPQLPSEFDEGNARLTQRLAAAVSDGGVPLMLFTSSVRAEEDTHYGRTKRAAEDELIALSKATGCVVAIFRLPQVFGRGARPHYNSIVATLLADAAEGRETQVDNPDAPIELVDVADVVAALAATVVRPLASAGFLTVSPSYSSTVGEIAQIAADFRVEGRDAHRYGLKAALWDAYCGYVEQSGTGYN